jgi:MFS family permease
VGRRPVYLAGVVTMGVMIFPAFALFNTGVFIWMLLAHILMFGIGLALAGGPTAAMFSEMFGSRIRYTGASVGYQLAGLLGAALSPIIAASLYEKFQTGYAIAIYVAGTALISLVAVTLIPESKDIDVVHEVERAAV